MATSAVLVGVFPPHIGDAHAKQAGEDDDGGARPREGEFAL
jgi:hypothetical protein